MVVEILASEVGVPRLVEVREKPISAQQRLIQALLTDLQLINEEVPWPAYKKEHISNGSALKEKIFSKSLNGSAFKGEKHSEGSALKEENSSNGGNGSALKDEKNTEGGNGSAFKEENYSEGSTLKGENNSNGGNGSALKEEKNTEGGNGSAYKGEKHSEGSALKEENSSNGGNGSALKDEKNTEGGNARSSKNKFDIRSQKTFYTKAKGVASMKGQMFEIKMSALLYLRALNDKSILEFHLGNNVEGAAAYDDLLVKIKKDDDPAWKTCFVQLKHKETASIGLKTCMGKGDFSLKKYWQSYKRIKARMEKSTKDFLFEGSFENCEMVLYTNAKLHPELSKRERFSKPSDIDPLFNSETGKQVIFNFDKYCDHEIFEQLVEDEDSTEEIVEFLSALRVFSGQPSESQLDDFIKKELLIATDMIKPDINMMYQTYIENISKWWSDGNTTLNHESDILKRTSETCKVNIMSTREVKQHCFDLTFHKDVVSSPDNLYQAPLTHIMCNEMSTKLSCTKLIQSLQSTQYGYIILSLESLLKEKEAVMLAWSNQDIPILIVVCESKAKHEYLTDLESICVTLCEGLQKYTDKHMIVVSSRDDTFTTKLKNVFWDYNVIEDNIHINQLEKECKDKFISKEILFQGQWVKLYELFQGVDGFLEGVFNDAFVEHILREDIWRLGPRLDKPVSNYVPRTLSRNDALKKEVLKESPDVFIVNDISAEDLRKMIPQNEGIGQMGDRSPHRFHVFAAGSDTDTSEVYARHENVHELEMCSDGVLRWVNTKGSVEHIKSFIDLSQPSMSRPKTAMDIKSRIVLVTGSPGMGKTSLLTHLAAATKATHPSSWVIKVSLNEQMYRLKSMSLEDGVEFLEAALGIDKTFPSVRALFRHSIKVQGNAVVFLDGFDEIAPNYTLKGLQLLSSLMTTKVSKILISTRHSMKDKLENHLSVLSFSLLPFNVDDQREFFCKLWSRDEGSHQDLQVVQKPLEKTLAYLKETFNDINELLGIPLLSVMLAEVFKDQINDCHFGKQDLLSLFERFVDKKFEIHLRKMCPMYENVDYEIEELLKRRVIDDHMYAALVALLDSAQLQSLNKADKIIKRNNLFCTQVEESKITMGIVEKCFDNKAVFINRLFAEYFVALYLSKHINESRTFVNKYLCLEEFEIVRRFLDLMPNNAISVSKL